MAGSVERELPFGSVGQKTEMQAGAVDAVLCNGRSHIIRGLFQLFHSIAHGNADACFDNHFHIIHTVTEGNGIGEVFLLAEICGKAAQALCF